MRHFGTSDYNKFTKEIIDTKIREKGSLDKSNISNLVKTLDLHTKVTLATKLESKVEQGKIVKLQTCDLGYSHGKDFFGDNCFHKMFSYQPTLNNHS